ncbi:MAG: ATP-binding protein [Candidatus Altiarchaeota archaeon]
MDSAGLVVGSVGSRVEVQVLGDQVELGSVLNIGGHFGIVAQMRYDEDDRIGARQRLIATVQIFGRLEGGRLHKVKRPVKPNERAKFATDSELEGILSQEEKISVGSVLGTGARAYLNAGEYDRHTAILASTGAGKSYTAANLVKEYAALGLPVVIVDTHGEYAGLLSKLAEGGSFAVKTLTVKYERKGYEKVLIPLCDLEARDFHHFTGLSEPQESALGMIIEKLSGSEYTLDDMIGEAGKLDISVIHEATQQALTRKLMKLKSVAKGVFDRYGTDINALVEPYQVTIIDASMAAEGIRRSVISYLSKELLQGRINKVNDLGEKKLEYPLLFVIEEAHNYAGSSLTHSCKSQLQRIASEGRKFGIGLVVISQKPSKIDEEILSQCNSGLYMHITNPRDKDHIKKSFESISEEIIAGLDTLDVGECIIAGAILDIPFLLCKVDRIEMKREKTSKFGFKRREKPRTGGFGYV